MNARCPSCLRERLSDHPAGLVYDHGLACPLLAAEDATKIADADKLSNQYARYRSTRITRPTTETERTLLAALGHTITTDAMTTVDSITPGVIRRTWPGINLDAQPATTSHSQPPTTEPAP